MDGDTGLVTWNASVAKKCNFELSSLMLCSVSEDLFLGLCMSGRKGKVRLQWKSMKLRACVKYVPPAHTLPRIYLTGFEIFICLFFDFPGRVSL